MTRPLLLVWKILFAMISSVGVFGRMEIRVGIQKHISERSSSAKLMLNESTKRNAWLSLRDAKTWKKKIYGF